MGADIAVAVADVSKKYRLYHERNQSLKAAVMRGRRAIAEEFWALRDVSFEVPAGKTFGLIGENGSGKSTMLKCLARILVPDGGTVDVRGKVSALLELGAGFHPELSGRENVYLNGAILGLRRKELERRFDDIVDFAGVGQFIDEPVKNYSSGMYVRLGFSVAINVDPDVLLVDEVLAVGDEAFQRKSSEKFAELKERGTTIVVVSHSMGSVQTLCDEVAWFEHGHLKEIGAPRDVIEAYTGEVQVDRRIDEDGQVRWGSGEVRITQVEWLDPDGAPLKGIHTGAPAKVRMHYEAAERVVQPGFGLAFRTIEGMPISGPNSIDVDCIPDAIEGRGYVDVDFDRLLLLPGTYDLSVGICDRTKFHTYDHRQNLQRLDVERGSIYEQFGYVSLAPRWTITPHDRRDAPAAS
ncbi:ABC transporter ATP-binding protein [Acidiferrimicrobium sp. IK]|uniref:ABC transporter ATP-binding protein n=1 Tax=Acidiferrimicrobium sp. IK TaxID=2871700 RepID=UPI0021CAEF97|nr:ABC transporter ATP-binding protein [Acidiferrimicrobium sp. IK]MCU4185563.1 ABC transporter ATP-binding protein [Acidiferrimicrobium sp. IK]